MNILVPFHLRHRPPRPMADSVIVIGPHFCVPHQVDLKVKKTAHTLKGDTFDILDVSNSIVFQVKDKMFSFHEHHVLVDFAGDIIINLKQKTLTRHQRWKVYRGKSRHKQDLLFSVAKPKGQQILKPELHVFLASNTNKDRTDFRIEGSWSAGSFAIYSGESSTIIAQLPANSSLVTVYPNIDYAFIATLAVILYEICEGVDRSAPVLLKAFGTAVLKGLFTAAQGTPSGN